MRGGVDERRETRWKSWRKREKLSINSTGWKDGWRDKGMISRRRRRGENSSVLLFNPLFIIIPLGKNVHLRKKDREGRRKREARGDLIKEIKCRKSEVCSP